jgi:transcriptional regulator with XRE-family HTH domain
MASVDARGTLVEAYIGSGILLGGLAEARAMSKTKTLGSLIREARERAKLTQAELAARAGTSQPAIARYEAGQAIPRFDTARRLVEACGEKLRVELAHESPQRRAAADAALARSVEDRLRTNDSFTAFVAQLRRG